MPNLTKNWTWVSYASGAAGKLICNLIQQSKKYDKWNKVSTADLDRFCKKTMPTKLERHLSKEINQPYKLNWYSRELPYTRGDNLTVKEVNNNIQTHNPQILNKHIVLPWTKNLYPKWFAGKIVQIVNDKDSLNFLKHRRDELFYKWIDDKHVNFLMRDPKYHDKKIVPLMMSFTDTPPIVQYYKSKKHFYDTEFYNHKEIVFYSKQSRDKRVIAHINLSDIIQNRTSLIVDKLETCLHIKIVKSRAKIIFDNWQQQNKKLLEKMGE